MHSFVRRLGDAPADGLLVFFFQAEDGIRDWSVTGVQTCALPISRRPDRVDDGLSAFTITIVSAIWAAGTIAALIAVPFVAECIGRRGVMLAAVATMIVAAAELAAWKAVPGLLLGRLLTGVSVGMAAGTAITYLIELRLRADPNASPGLARTIGTSVNVGALGVGPLVAGCLAAWASHPLTLPYLVWIALGVVALVGLAAAPETGAPAAAPAPFSVRLPAPAGA